MDQNLTVFLIPSVLISKTSKTTDWAPNHDSTSTMCFRWLYTHSLLCLSPDHLCAQWQWFETKVLLVATYFQSSSSNLANLFPLRPFLTRFPRTGPMLGLCWIFIFLIFKGHDFQILSICRYFFSPSTSSSVLHLSGYLTNLRLHHSVVVAYKYWIEIDHSRPLKFFLSLGPWKQNIMK